MPNLHGCGLRINCKYCDILIELKLDLTKKMFFKLFINIRTFGLDSFEILVFHLTGVFKAINNDIFHNSCLGVSLFHDLSFFINY